MEPSLYVDPNNQLQVEWADKVVGKLLAPQMQKTRGGGQRRSLQKIVNRSILLSASYPWPQREPLYSTGPFNGTVREWFPLPPMHDTRTLQYGEWTSKCSFKWEGELLRASQLPKELVALPLQ